MSISEDKDLQFATYYNILLDKTCLYIVIDYKIIMKLNPMIFGYSNTLIFKHLAKSSHRFGGSVLNSISF
jgi:hypothetical protein